MPVPKRKRSRARRDSRFANKFIKTKAFAECANCQDVIVPHTVCTKCGFYKGEKIMKTKLDRAVTRADVRAKKATRAPQQEGAIEADAQ